MPYLGNTPASNFASVTKDTFSGDGSTTAFTLSKAATTNGVAVFVENVRQEPTTAYAVSGTTLTFTAAPVSASGNNIYVLHHNTPASTATHPAAQDLTCAGFTSTGIDDNADATSITIDSSENVGIKTTTPTNYYADDLVVTAPDEGGITVVGGTAERNYLAFADGTSGDAQYRGLISYDHNTDILGIGAGGGTKIQLDGNGHMTNATQPALFVQSGNDANKTGDGTTFTIELDVERYDVNSDFNTTNYTFTAPVTGKYFMSATISLEGISSHERVRPILATSNRNYTSEFHGDNLESSNEVLQINSITTVADMDANDTATFTIAVFGGSKDVDIRDETSLSIALVC